MSREDPQIKLRLPEALRERIKTYADAHKRSMNAEIVRILEREFPEPWDMTGRVTELVEMMKFIRDGKARDQNVHRMAEIIKDTIEGIATGRVRGVDDEARQIIAHEWNEYQEELHKYDDRTSGYDQAEYQSLQRSGTTKKYVWPDGEIGPAQPKPKKGGGIPKDYDDPDFPD
jgi:hypothetical protein